MNSSLQLSWAAQDGNVAELRRLAALGANVNAEAGDGQRPLHTAASNGHVEAIRALAELGADVHAATAGGETPLHSAARNGHVEAMRALVRLGANVQAQDAVGRTPLHLAALNGHVEAMRALVDLGADVHAEAADGQRPLHWAAFKGHMEVMQALVALGANVNAEDAGGSRPLHTAAWQGHVEAMSALVVELGADLHALTTRGNTALHRASTTETVTWLLEAGAELNRRNDGGETPLIHAIRWGHVPAVTALVQAGACPDASDSVWWTRLFVGAVTGIEAAVTELVAAAEVMTRRLNENGHFARTAVQAAELSTHYRREELRHALTAAQH
jgi:cytohesin